MGDAPLFQFLPVTPADKPLLRRWLASDHAQTWWGEPEHEISLIFEGQASGESRGFIAHHDGQPFAYIQCWPCAAQPDHAIADEPWVRDQSPGTLGVDITIGDHDLLGKGLGSACVRAFCQKLFAQGVPRLIIDPDADNQRAVRAYQKAGFVSFDRFTNADGSITHLMEMFPSKGHEIL